MSKNEYFMHPIVQTFSERRVLTDSPRARPQSKLQASGTLEPVGKDWVDKPWINEPERQVYCGEYGQSRATPPLRSLSVAFSVLESMNPGSSLLPKRWRTLLQGREESRRTCRAPRGSSRVPDSSPSRQGIR